jgi:hypothetical protein
MESITITLPDTNAHNLHDLMVTADAARAASLIKGLDLITDFREMTFLADDGNGANNIAVGRSDVTDAVYSFKLAAGASKLYRIPKGVVRCKELYVKASAGTPTFHIEGQP